MGTPDLAGCSPVRHLALQRVVGACVGLQARALLVAAEGALSAYAHLTGEDWKPRNY